MVTKHTPITIESTSIGEAVLDARQRLSSLSETAGLDAQVLVAHISNQNRSWVLAHPEEPLSMPQAQELEMALKRLEEGEPLPYVLGEWEFFGLKFAISPAVLIPRPETELLVETAITWLKAHPKRVRVGEVGTGSGCIGTALAANLPEIQVIASDISREALRTAQGNALRHNVSNQITFVYDDLLSPRRGPFDLVCANLPYIPSEKLRSLDVYGREPTLALDGGPDGLNFIERLLAYAHRLLASGGMVLLEIEATQGETARDLGCEAFPHARVEVKHDLAGHPRLLVIETQST